MDIKDFILVGGGLLIVAVVAHGFWIAWRARREPFRLDIVPDLISEDMDDIERLRGELPNGGARVVPAPSSNEDQLNWEQARFELDTPATILLEATEAATDGVAAEHGRQTRVTRPVEPTLGGTPNTDADVPPPGIEDSIEQAVDDPPRAEVADVILPEEPVPQTPRTRRLVQRPAKPERVEPAPVEELIVFNLLAPKGAPFAGDVLFTVLRSQGL
ncbi:MAG: hypothetical protein O7G86_14945, partial [Gammaproteobacteria bacterium]|nr:hypothetical protein [Gammaproteobacteria bacterium]